MHLRNRKQFTVQRTVITGNLVTLPQPTLSMFPCRKPLGIEADHLYFAISGNDADSLGFLQYVCHQSDNYA